VGRPDTNGYADRYAQHDTSSRSDQHLHADLDKYTHEHPERYADSQPNPHTNWYTNRYADFHSHDHADAGAEVGRTTARAS